MKKRDRLMAIFWILFGLTISIWSATFAFGGPEDPGPGFFPLGLGLIIAAFGMIMFFQTMKRKEDDPLRPSAPFVLHRAGVRRVVFCLLGMLFSAALFKTLGFVLAMFLMILFMMRTIEPQKWRTALFYSVISALGSLFIFKFLLKTMLPNGILGF